MPSVRKNYVTFCGPSPEFANAGRAFLWFSEKEFRSSAPLAILENWFKLLILQKCDKKTEL